MGDLFRPLLADPKQSQFFISINRFRSSGVRYTTASVGFGETFGLHRFVGSREGNGLQHIGSCGHCKTFFSAFCVAIDATIGLMYEDHIFHL